MNTTPRWMTWLRSGLTVIFVVYVASQTWEAIDPNGNPDPMFISGSATCLLGLWLCGSASERIHFTVEQMRRNAVLSINQRQLLELHQQLDAEAGRTAKIGALITGLSEVVVVLTGAIAVPWYHNRDTQVIRIADGTLLIGTTDILTFIGLLLIGAIAAVGAGWYLGSLAGYGRIAAMVEKTGGRLRAQADAADHMGGLRPLASFAWRQSALTLLPLAWLSVWLVLTSFGDLAHRYGIWRAPFILLFVLALYFAILGFLQPARALTRLFTEQEEAANGHERLQEVIASARRRAGPLVAGFWLLIPGMASAIILSGVWTISQKQGGLTSFFFGLPG